MVVQFSTARVWLHFNFISRLVSCSNRFCGVKFVDSCGLSCLLLCVYMPVGTASSEYLNTLGKLQCFMASQHFDILMLILIVLVPFILFWLIL